MAKNLFDKLYAAGEAVVQAVNKPMRKKMLLRAAERVADDLESKCIAYEVKEQELLHSLANCEDEDKAIRLYKELAMLNRETEEAAALVSTVLGMKSKLFEELVTE
jgi:K+-sensing histidine kinase KdpD